LTYLGFITEGKLAAVLITPSLGVPNWPVIYIINTAPPMVDKLFVSWFFISAFVRHEKITKGNRWF
jgi:hypothetical protein